MMNNKEELDLTLTNIQNSINDDTLNLNYIDDRLRLTPETASELLKDILPDLPNELCDYPGFNLSFVLLPLCVGIGTMLGRHTYLNIPNVRKKLKPNLMAVQVVPPGGGKTRLMQTFLTNHLNRFDETLRKRFDTLKEAEAMSKKNKEPQEGTQPISRLRDMKLCMLSNMTAARLASAATYNALCVSYDDVSEFKRIFGVESKNPDQNYSSMLLSLYSDYSIRIDRQGEDNDFHTSDALVSCWINAQPQLLEFFLEKSFIGSGLTWRFVPIILEEDDETVDFKNYKLKTYPYMPFLDMLYNRIFNSFYDNPSVNKLTPEEFNYSKEAEEYQLYLNEKLEWLGTQVLSKKLKKVKRAEMVSKMREMIDKFAFIIQVITDNIKNGFEDQGLTASNNRIISKKSIDAAWVYSRLIYDQWIRLHAVSNVKDNECDEMRKDQSWVGKKYEQALVEILNSKAGTIIQKSEIVEAIHQSGKDKKFKQRMGKIFKEDGKLIISSDKERTKFIITE